jgi:hypothetical protein
LVLPRRGGLPGETHSTPGRGPAHRPADRRRTSGIGAAGRGSCCLERIYRWPQQHRWPKGGSRRWLRAIGQARMSCLGRSTRSPLACWRSSTADTCHQTWCRGRASGRWLLLHASRCRHRGTDCRRLRGGTAYGDCASDRRCVRPDQARGRDNEARPARTVHGRSLQRTLHYAQHGA